MSDDEDMEMAEGPIRDQRVVTLEVPIDDIHEGALDKLEAAGVDVEGQLEQQLRPNVEQGIHDILQSSKYQR